MSTVDGFGSDEDVLRLLRASGATLDAMLQERFGKFQPDEAAPDQGPPLVAMPSGLIVPESVVSGPDPFDQYQVYLTPDDVFGAELSMDAIIGQIARVPLEAAISWASRWMAKISRVRRPRRDVDVEFVESYLRGPAQVKAVNLLRDGRRVLLTPQALVVLMKLAFEYCEQLGPVSEPFDERPLIIATLTLPSHMSEDVDEASESDFLVGDQAGRIGRHFIANQMFNNSRDWRTAWAVAQRCLRQLPDELVGLDDKVVDFAAAYAEATGVRLDDLVAVTSACWARTVTGDPVVHVSYFKTLGWTEARLDAALGLIAAAPEALREMLAAEREELGLFWSLKTFDQFPVVRWGEFLTVMHPSLVVNRGTGLWPLFDVRREMDASGDRQRYERIARSVRHTNELCALEVVQSLASDARYFNDDALRRAYGKKRQVADAAVDYGHSWVVLEVTTEGFQLKSAAGVSEEAIGRDLDDVVRKAGQVQATIDNIRNNEGALVGNGSAPQRRRRFLPVVVVASRFPGSPITFTMLKEKLAKADVLQADDIAPLQVLEWEDLHAMECACEQLGYSFLGLLEAKARVERPLVAMREFLVALLGHNAPYPERIDTLHREWLDTTAEMFRPKRAESA